MSISWLRTIVFSALEISIHEFFVLSIGIWPIQQQNWIATTMVYWYNFCFSLNLFTMFIYANKQTNRCRSLTSILSHCAQYHVLYLESINVKWALMHHFFTPKPVQQKCLLPSYQPIILCSVCIIRRTIVKMAFPLVNYWRRLVFQGQVFHLLISHGP